MTPSPSIERSLHRGMFFQDGLTGSAWGSLDLAYKSLKAPPTCRLRRLLPFFRVMSEGSSFQHCRNLRAAEATGPTTRNRLSGPPGPLAAAATQTSRCLQRRRTNVARYSGNDTGRRGHGAVMMTVHHSDDAGDDDDDDDDDDDSHDDALKMVMAMMVIVMMI